MFLLSQSIGIFLSLRIITLIVAHLPIPVSADFGPLLPPSNVTDLISAVNDTSSYEQNTTLPDPGFFDSENVWAGNAPATNLSSPPTATSSPSLPPEAPKFSCNGKAYGRNLNYASCIEAWSKFPSGSTLDSFGERGQGSWGANLPLRILSSNGLCAFDIGHKKGVIFDSISRDSLKDNARVLLDICVKGEPNVGGIVTNLGHNGNLILRVVPYRPSVRCAPLGEWNPGPTDCRFLLDEMATDGTERVFGSKDDPDPAITVKMPVGYRMRRCEAFIDALVPGSGVDTSDWYKICTYIAGFLLSNLASIIKRRRLRVRI